MEHSKWEYKFIVFSLTSSVLHEIDKQGPFEEAQTWLNQEGAAGWEVISLLPKMGSGDWTIALLKRPLTGSPA
jgi:hypothetical protein